jgi:FtsZ-binding cell division protein ZapB
MIKIRDSLTEKDDLIQQLQVEVEDIKMKTEDLMNESGQLFMSSIRAKDHEIDQLREENQAV